MFEEDDLLESLLTVASEELEKIDKKERFLKETDIFKQESNTQKKEEECSKKKSTSEVHKGDTDSSDDEENRYYENSKYSESGKQIKQLLASSSPTISSSFYGQPKKRISTWNKNPNINHALKTSIQPAQKPADVFIDPVFGMRIVNPLVSSIVLTERMIGREAVPFSRIARYIQFYKKDKDWVICGVLVNKSSARTSQKGNQFSIWTLSDLKDDIKTVSLFLFGSAHKELWKTVVGTVVGILNPNVLDRKDGSKDEATLSVDNPQKLMIFGQSKDFGICKSMKKNGEKCTAIVNVSRCEFCIYHIKQEYQKCSKRSELQSNFAGKGLTALRNKVLGKNEVFYAGKSYTAIPAKKNKKLEQKDQNRLESLNLKGICQVSNNVTKAKTKKVSKKKQAAKCLEVSHAQRLRDLELLKKLGGTDDLESKDSFTATHSSNVSLEESKNLAVDVVNKLKLKKNMDDKKLDVAMSNKYDLKSDLILNIESKGSFDGKISEEVSLDESKATALNVIAKLKSKNHQKRKSVEEKIEESNVDMFADEEFNLDYDMDVGTSDINTELGEHPIPPSKIAYSENVEDICKENGSSTTETDLCQSQFTCQIQASASAVKSSENSNHPLRVTQNGCERIGGSNASIGITSPISCPNTKTFANKSPRTNGSLALRNNSSVPNDLVNSGIRETIDTQLHSKLKPNVTKTFPVLSASDSNVVDLSTPVVRKSINAANLSALKYIQKNGPIKKIDPNNTKGSGKKRLSDVNDKEIETAPKKSKLQESEFISDRFKKMMAATSKHTELLQDYDNLQQEKYFKKLEAKETLEEKMTKTYKVACKAVRCLKCKYTSFSATDFCKNERHPLKVFDATKRFFKCGDCGNRTVCLSIIPTQPCKNCGSGKWEKTGMMKDKKAVMAHALSIRGGEQKFVNSVVADANLDLLVPDD